MKTVRYLTTKIMDEYEVAVADLKQQRDLRLQAVVDKYCPVLIGDKVECNQYAYRGKQMIAERIEVAKSVWDGRFVVTGPVIKKDGTPSDAQYGQHVIATDKILLAEDDISQD